MEQFDVYCERTDFSFWSEPINALTNLAFIIAAAIAFLRRPRGANADWPFLILTGLVAAIGIGSFLFHTFANRWSSLADVLPILMFIYFFFFMALRRLFGLGLWVALAGTVAFFAAASLSLPLFRPFVGYSAGYVPGFVAMLVTGIALLVGGQQRAGLMLSGAVLFGVSITFRVLDTRLCDGFPLGTHFLWHIFNAIVLYLLLQVISKPEKSELTRKQ